jgi:hypothetical protein
MKNIHILPTEKPSKLYFWKDKFRFGEFVETQNNFKLIYQNIHITSDEEIEKDYVIAYGVVIKVMMFDKETLYFVNGTKAKREECKKIILTTDQDLIKDGVQTIDDEFLEWFVKNPSCEFVEVDYNEYEMFGNKSKKWIDSHSCYEIIIPKEDWLLNNPQCKQIESCSKSLSKKCICPKEEPTIEEEYLKDELKKYDGIDVVVLNKPEEPKQKTLEKYIEREFQFNSSTVIQNQEYVYLMNKNRFKIAVNNILKYQKEQDKKMYSEEEVRKISLDFFYHWWNAKGSNTEQGFDKWFEQIKK